MKLYQAILNSVLLKEPAQISFPNLNMDLDRLIELECYRTLEKIYLILTACDSMEDEHEMLMRIKNLLYLHRQGPTQADRWPL